MILYVLFSDPDLRLENSDQSVVGCEFHGGGGRETPKWNRALSGDLLSAEVGDGGGAAVEGSCRSDGAEGEGE